MNGTPSPPKGSPDSGSKKFGGDRSKPSVYKGPSKKWSAQRTGPILSDEAAGGGWGAHASGATTGADAVLDKRTQFEKDFDAKQAAWQDNDDRTDDALYHRSFDDNSMHLTSTKYRDGKPVDNQGKQLGNAGMQYRRHDLQGATVENESA